MENVWTVLEISSMKSFDLPLVSWALHRYEYRMVAPGGRNFSSYLKNLKCLSWRRNAGALNSRSLGLESCGYAWIDIGWVFVFVFAVARNSGSCIRFCSWQIFLLYHEKKSLSYIWFQSSRTYSWSLDSIVIYLLDLDQV